MTEQNFGKKLFRRVREEVKGGNVEDIIKYSTEDIYEILEGWETIYKNATELGVEAFKDFLYENPKYLTFFSESLNIDSLADDEFFVGHVRAIMRGINLAINNLIGIYEEENEVLPAIAHTHHKRGITPNMMSQLKTCLLTKFNRFLNSNKTERAAWEDVMDLIFNNYIIRYIPKEIEETVAPSSLSGSKTTETQTQLKKLLNAVKSDRRNSAEKSEAEGPLENEGQKEINSQVALPVNLLRRQSLVIKTSPTLSDRRPSRSLLHPDHAKFMVQRRSSLLTPPLQRYNLSFEESSRAIQNGGFITSPLSSSAASSVTSISNGPTPSSHVSDPLHNYESRRSSTMTNKYSLLDALDLEYALIKAAARGSIGPYSLSQSLQKLTFTQSLAFPALARGISNKKNSSQSSTRGPLDPLESGVNAFAKVATVLVLVLISVLVFGVLYKFIRT